MTVSDDTPHVVLALNLVLNTLRGESEVGGCSTPNMGHEISATPINTTQLGFRLSDSDLEVVYPQGGNQVYVIAGVRAESEDNTRQSRESTTGDGERPSLLEAETHQSHLTEMGIECSVEALTDKKAALVCGPVDAGESATTESLSRSLGYIALSALRVTDRIDQIPSNSADS